MNLLQRIERWGDSHHPMWLDGIRVLLGMYLIWKGISFVGNINVLNSVIERQPFLSVLSMWVAHYIVFAHIAGGLLIMLGLLTRYAALANLPVLIGALLFVHEPTGLFLVHNELPVTLIVFFLLIVFLVEGSGRFSIDENMRRHPEKPTYHPH
ncbi:putative membrane protein YphA (DoxX/SURF4 family) [Chitinophaga skermanii]|uniref:Putative membrane protein YphA (DoxX/SURF4 family) n=1 Tax=Chitinophaga skermanii TaxID=331697 RepID=A0A327QYV6_9BACT|nr:DoxX family membrane protein [Chitinophaga skermanii]RAJ06847.1 putative membrane protein YphA (DoxX/SURF4 family) [Chitinophaga skermanii]